VQFGSQRPKDTRLGQLSLREFFVLAGRVVGSLILGYTGKLERSSAQTIAETEWLQEPNKSLNALYIDLYNSFKSREVFPS
jgi:hypothetical protein